MRKLKLWHWALIFAPDSTAFFRRVFIAEGSKDALILPERHQLPDEDLPNFTLWKLAFETTVWCDGQWVNAVVLREPDRKAKSFPRTKHTAKGGSCTCGQTQQKETLGVQVSATWASQANLSRIPAKPAQTTSTSSHARANSLRAIGIRTSAGFNALEIK